MAIVSWQVGHTDRWKCNQNKQPSRSGPFSSVFINHLFKGLRPSPPHLSVLAGRGTWLQNNRKPQSFSSHFYRMETVWSQILRSKSTDANSSILCNENRSWSTFWMLNLKMYTKKCFSYLRIKQKTPYKFYYKALYKYVKWIAVKVLIKLLSQQLSATTTRIFTVIKVSVLQTNENNKVWRQRTIYNKIEILEQ